MRTWESLRDKKVGIWGVGVEGQATLRRLAATGITPTAVVSDRAAPGVEALHDGGLEKLLKCDVVIKSPGISRYLPEADKLRGAGVVLTSGLDLWMAGAPRERVICVTGTKGKSTTSAIAGALISGLGHSVFVGGNIGTPPWDPDSAEADWYVIETSSYQAVELTHGPAIVVVTSLGQDHLPWHGDYETYVRDKLSICSLADVRQVIVPNWDQEIARHENLLGNKVTWVEDSSPSWVNSLKVIGSHNKRNALLAREALVQIGVPNANNDNAIAEAAESYEPLPSRLTEIGRVNDVIFVDDSLSTNTLPTIAAIETFSKERLAIILGGKDRGIDYQPLALALADHEGELLIATIPDNGPRIAQTIRATSTDIEVQECADLASAVEKAFAWANPSGVVLLSPAAPSFGVFKDYADRSRAFKALMEEIASENAKGPNRN